MPENRSKWLRHALPEEFPSTPDSVLVQSVEPTLEAAILGIANSLVAPPDTEWNRDDAMGMASCIVMEAALGQLITHAGPKAKSGMVMALLSEDPALEDARRALVKPLMAREAKAFRTGLALGALAGTVPFAIALALLF